MRLFRNIILSILLLQGCAGKSGTVFFKADDPGIRYVGRTEISGDGSVSFDWSGTYLSFKFTGGYCAVKVSDTGKNYYNIFIDGKQTGVATTSGTDTLVVLCEGLSGRDHLLRLQKRTEGEQGKTTIHGFLLAKGEKLNPISDSEQPERHIEFIGNSLTCGYGTEGKDKAERFRPDTENCDLAFSCITARYFNADYTLIAHSGRGAARNYGDSLTVSQNTMTARMLRTFDEYPEPLWNFGSSPYKPNLVVINLGSNDFSTLPHPSREEFVRAYEKIISQIRDGYGQVPILCVAPRIGEPAFTYIRALCESSKDKRLHFAAILPGTYAETELGSDSHPNYTGQRKMAMALIPHISTITGWEIKEYPVK